LAFRAVLIAFIIFISNFVTFIDKISKYPRAIQIANIGMSKDSEGKYIFRFDLTAYYLPVK
jgi:hypothetical protein